MYVKKVEYKFLVADDEAMAYADNIVGFGILTEKSFDDCTYIAAAVMSNCDIIASWNFKHKEKRKKNRVYFKKNCYKKNNFITITNFSLTFHSSGYILVKAIQTQHIVQVKRYIPIYTALSFLKLSHTIEITATSIVPFKGFKGLITMTLAYKAAATLLPVIAATGQIFRWRKGVKK